MTVKRLKAQARLMHEGKITFVIFARTTAEERRKLATKFFRMWSLPVDVAIEDVEQEMLVAMWKASKEFDPERGNSVEIHIIWRACDAAQKWLNKRRNSKRRDNGAPSRNERALSTFAIGGDDDPYARFEPNTAVLGYQDEIVDTKALIEVLPECAETESGRRVLVAWLGAYCDVEEAASALYADPTARFRFQFDSEAHARCVVREEVSKIIGGNHE